MISIYDEIKKKITREINPENITLVDNSNLHKKHKSFDINKFHFIIIIESKKLKKMSKIEAHKKIFSSWKEEMKNKIHALEIEII